MIKKVHHRRVAAVIYAAAGILALFIGLGLLSRLVAGAGPNIDLIIRSLTVIGFIISARWISRGKVVRGASLALVAAMINGVLTLATQDGQIPLVASLTLLMFIALIIYTFPERQVAPALIVVTLASLALILADIFWPWPRPRLTPELNIFRLPLAVILFTALILVILRGFSRFKLGNKLIITFMSISLLPLGILALIMATVTQNFLIADANQVLEVAAIQTASDVDNFFTNGLTAIISEARLLDLTAAAALAQGKTVKATDHAEILGHLNSYRDTAPLSIISVALLDRDGQVVLDTIESNLGNDESGRSYFIHSLNNNRPFVSNVEFLPNQGQPVLNFSAPVKNEAGETVGVLRATYEASILQDLVADNTGLVGGDSFGVLFDENQLHLAHGRAPETLFKTVDMLPAEKITTLQDTNRLPEEYRATLSTNLPELQQKLADAAINPYFTAVDVATAEKINQVAVVSIRTHPWLVGYFQPQELFLAPIDSLTRLIVLAGVMIAGLVTVVATIASRYLVHPIEQLTAVAAQVAGGNLTARADVITRDEIGTLATTFNMMAGRLETILSDLEERVAQRTQALETSARVSRSVSTILDQDELVQAVVQQVYEAFDYYHMQIYIYDAGQNRLVLAAGYGKEGESPVIKQHSLALGEGLVGRAANQNAPVLVMDTSVSADWKYNPRLPDTKAEVAVPISIGNEVLGVLDVQHDQVAGLQQDDVDVLQSFANQVAVALRNARLFNEAQRRAERERLVNQIGQKISDTNSVETALQTAIRELGQAFRARQARVELGTSPGTVEIEVGTRPVNGQPQQLEPDNGVEARS